MTGRDWSMKDANTGQEDKEDWMGNLIRKDRCGREQGG